MRIILFTIVSVFLTHTAAYGDTMVQQEKIKKVFNDLRATNIDILDDFYAPKSLFIDPIDTQNGIEDIKAYYKNIYETVESIEFVEKDMISTGNKHVFVWLMKLKASGLKNGEEVQLHGTSVIHFNDQDLVEYHRDYYDMGEFIYEHIPVLGFIVKKTKERLKHK